MSPIISFTTQSNNKTLTGSINFFVFMDKKKVAEKINRWRETSMPVFGSSSLVHNFFSLAVTSSANHSLSPSGKMSSTSIENFFVCLPILTYSNLSEVKKIKAYIQFLRTSYPTCLFKPCNI